MKATVTFQIPRLLLTAGWLFAAAALRSEAASPIPTGVPEPGLILWGAVVNATNAAQPISIASASWSVSDGSNTAVYAQMTRPPVRTFTQGGQSFYVLEVPFDTRRFGGIQLSDPATEGVRSFELMSASPPAYLLTPTINGMLAAVRSIDGAASGASNVTVAGFNAGVRGRVIRVDLAITPTTETYEQWATRLFGSSSSPSAAPGADPDHDGLSNAGEYAAGTNPLDPASVFRLLQVSVSGNQATVNWQSVAAKQYVIESATSIAGPWTDAGSMLSSSAVSQASVTRPDPAHAFFRVRVVAP